MVPVGLYDHDLLVPTLDWVRSMIKKKIDRINLSKTAGAAAAAAARMGQTSNSSKKNNNGSGGLTLMIGDEDRSHHRRRGGAGRSSMMPHDLQQERQEQQQRRQHVRYRYADEQNVEESFMSDGLPAITDMPLYEEKFDPFRKTGRPFGSLRKEVHYRYAQYLDDLTDGLNLNCLIAFVFVFTLCIAPALCFGGILGILDRRISAQCRI